MMRGMAAQNVEIEDVVERRTYEARLDGVLAGILQYARTTDRIDLIHTEVLPEFDAAVGHAGAILRDGSGLLRGGSDPRSDGGVAAW